MRWSRLNPLRKRRRGAARRAASIFRADWYLDRHPDLQGADVDPLEHYLATGWREGRSPHPLFDPRWYVARHPDARGQNPLLHYLRADRTNEAPSPGPLFDSEYYLRTYPDVRAAGVEPLTHYASDGHRESRRPNWLFEPDWYRDRYQFDGERTMEPLEHYLRFGDARGVNPHPLVEHRWYLARNPDVRASGLDAFTHYLEQGRFELRDPGPLFHAAWYAEQHPDFLDVCRDPLEHYLTKGWRANYRPNPLFEPRCYIERHRDHLGADTEPLSHFVSYGATSRCWPNRLFDTGWYVEQHESVAASGMNPLAHYLEIGAAVGCDPHRMFESAWYLETNPEVAAAGANPLAHYMALPADEKRWPHRLFDPDWYRANNPDVVRRRADPLIHFVEEGLSQRRDPNPWLDVAWYLRTNPDAEARGAQPVHHYLHVGGREDRDPGPLFENGWYRRTYLDGGSDGPNPLAHFLHGGAERGHEPRDPSAVYARAIVAEEQHHSFEAEAVQAHVEVMLYRPRFLIDAGDADPSPMMAGQVYADWQPFAAQAQAESGADTYLIRLPQGSRLAPTALYEFASALNRAPDADIVYADEDEIDAAGRRSNPIYKPAWSPDELESAPYLGFAACFRWSLARPLLAQTTCHYDFLLQVTEVARRIEHIDAMLLHRPSPPAEPDAGARALDCAALAARLQRSGRVGTVAAAARGYAIASAARRDGLTVIVIADDSPATSTRLERCLHDLERAGGDEPRQAIVVGRELGTIPPGIETSILHPGDDPGRSGWINLAASRARYEDLLILGTDLVPSDDGWLDRLRTHLAKPEVGACGAAILSPDRFRYEHLGVTVIDGDPRAITARTDRWPIGGGTARNRLAVASSCLLTRASLMELIGGFNRDLGDLRADFDYCQRLAERGYRTVCEASATLVREAGPVAPRPRRDRRTVDHFDRQWARQLVEDPLHPEYRADGDLPDQVMSRLVRA